MAKKVAASVKAAWVAAKKDFTDTPNTENLKQDVIDVLDFARNKAAMVKRSTDGNSSKSYAGSGGGGLGRAQPRVNQDVGSELLTHFKDEWAEIHSSTESSSLAISKMNADLQHLNISMTKSYGLIKNCWEEFAKLKEIIEVLDEAHGKVNELETLIQQVEEAIHECSVTKEEREKERRKHSLKKQHEKSIADSKSKVEQMKKVLANEQQLSLTLKYNMENRELKERQDAFQEIFARQMEDYRKKGEVDQPVTAGKVERSMSQLEEVEIEDEDGQASLHEFLSDVVLDDPSDPSEITVDDTQSGHSESPPQETENNSDPVTVVTDSSEPPK